MSMMKGRGRKREPQQPGSVDMEEGETVSAGWWREDSRFRWALVGWRAPRRGHRPLAARTALTLLAAAGSVEVNWRRAARRHDQAG